MYIWGTTEMHGETKGKRPLGRPKQMENIKLDLKNIVGREWTVIICLSHNRNSLAGWLALVKIVMNIQVL
jgi:hypothetical protein